MQAPLRNDHAPVTPTHATAPGRRGLRGRVARIAAVVLVASSALLTTGAPSAVAATRSVDKAERSEVAMINRFRAAHHLAPMRLDRTLTVAATWMARDLGTHHMFGHQDSRGRDPFQRMRAFGYPSTSTWRGENVAAGNAGVAATYAQWLNSPPHRANWLNPRFRAIGIARVQVPGSPYLSYWVTDFGSKWTGAPR